MSEYSPVPSQEERARFLGDVIATFTVQQLPQGAAPQTIREQWIGVPLPVREKTLNEAAETPIYTDALTDEQVLNVEAVPVYGYDAIEALQEAGRDDAAEFWHLQGFGFAELVFRASEGALQASEGINQG